MKRRLCTFLIFSLLSSLIIVHAQNWKKLALPETGDQIYLYATSNALLSLNFKGKCYSSHNGGQTWVGIQIGGSDLEGSKLKNFSVKYHENLILIETYAADADSSQYFLSEDGGLNYSQIRVPLQNSILQDFSKVGNNLFLITAKGSNKSYYSEDKGKTWVPSNHFYDGDSHFFYDIPAVSDTLFYSKTGKEGSWNKKKISGLQAGIYTGNYTFFLEEDSDAKSKVGFCKNDEMYISCALYALDSMAMANRLYFENLGVEFRIFKNDKLTYFFKTGTEVLAIYDQNLLKSENYGLNWTSLSKEGIEAGDTIIGLYKHQDHYVLKTLHDLYVYNSTLGIASNNEIKKSKIYLNAQNELVCTGFDSGMISLIDVQGRIRKDGLALHPDIQTIQLKDLPAGMYFAKVNQAGTQYVYRIVLPD